MRVCHKQNQIKTWMSEMVIELHIVWTNVKRRRRRNQQITNRVTRAKDVDFRKCHICKICIGWKLVVNACNVDFYHITEWEWYRWGVFSFSFFHIYFYFCSVAICESANQSVSQSISQPISASHFLLSHFHWWLSIATYIFWCRFRNLNT